MANLSLIICLSIRRCGHSRCGWRVWHLQRWQTGLLWGGAGADGGGWSQAAGGHGEEAGEGPVHRRHHARSEVKPSWQPTTFLPFTAPSPSALSSRPINDCSTLSWNALCITVWICLFKMKVLVRWGWNKIKNVLLSSLSSETVYDLI